MKNSIKFLGKIIVISIIYYLIVLIGVYFYYQNYPLNGKLVGFLNALWVMKWLINLFIVGAFLYLIYSIYNSTKKKLTDLTRGGLFAIVYILLGFYIFNFL